jgi:hypothetical protein
VVFAFPLCALFLAAGPVPGDGSEVARIQAGGWAYDGQGSALASNGATLVVGAPYGRSYAIDGSVRVYARDTADPSGWRETQRLEAPGFGEIDRFGAALDVDGNVLAVGAWREERARGAVYVYERPGANAPFEFVARLEPSFPGPAQRFGYSLDLDGERLLIGAPQGAPPPQQSWEGRAYVFERDPVSGLWRNAAEFAHPGPRPPYQPNFSFALALSGDLAALGTFYPGFGIATEVHVFVRDDAGWHHRQTLSERNVGGAGFQSFFGIALALAGNELLVMDPDRRAIHVFRRVSSLASEFAWSATFPADTGLVMRVFGERLAVGAPLFRAPTSVQLFRRGRNSWSRYARLFGSDPAATRVFGSGLAFDGERVLVGDPALPGPTQPEVGGVRVFEVP